MAPKVKHVWCQKRNSFFRRFEERGMTSRGTTVSPSRLHIMTVQKIQTELFGMKLGFASLSSRWNARAVHMCIKHTRVFQTLRPGGEIRSSWWFLKLKFTPVLWSHFKDMFSIDIVSMPWALWYGEKYWTRLEERTNKKEKKYERIGPKIFTI